MASISRDTWTNNSIPLPRTPKRNGFVAAESEDPPSGWIDTYRFRYEIARDIHASVVFKISKIYLTDQYKQRTYR